VGYVASIFRVEQYTKQEVSMKQAASKDMFLRNVGLIFNGLHGVISQKIGFFITTPVRTF
jgi:hypothetical protein